MLDDEVRREVRAALSRLSALDSSPLCRAFAAPILSEALLAKLGGESPDARARSLWELTAPFPEMQARLLEEAADAAVSTQDHALLKEASSSLRVSAAEAQATRSNVDPARSSNLDGSDRAHGPLDHYRAQRIAAWTGAPFELDARFVKLTLAVPDEAAQRPREYAGLDEVLTDLSSTGLLVDGAPGAGKSTLLRRLELEYNQADRASGDTERVVFYAALHDYAGDAPIAGAQSSTASSESRSAKLILRDWLEARFSAVAPNLPPLAKLLAEGRVVLLLDGINEMSLAATALERFRAFGAVIRDLPAANRVIVTSRSLDVQGLSELPRATVQPLNRARILELLTLRVSETAAKNAVATMERDRTLELYGNPYLLSLLADQLGEGGEVPRERATLFSRFVVRAILRELDEVNGERWRSAELLSDDDRTCVRAAVLPSPGVHESGALLEGLGRLAFAMQSHGKGEWRRETLPSALPHLARQSEAARVCLAAGVDVGVLEHDSKAGRVQFRHQLLQEFFAARAWLAQHAALPNGPPQATAALMTVAYRPHLADDPALGTPLLELMARLPPGAVLDERPASGWEEVSIMAVAQAPDDRFVLDLLDVDPVQAARATLGEGGRVVEPSTAERVRARVATWMSDPKIELRARIDAGLALDRPDPLGFERKVSEDGHEYLLPPRVRVPAGTYRIGSAPHDEKAWDNEKPIRKVTVPSPFELAKFPVTNAEYACFMAAGGYEDDRWWPAGSEGRAWRDGEHDDTVWAEEVRSVQSWSDAVFEDKMADQGVPEAVREAWRLRRRMPFNDALADVRPRVHPGLLRRPEWWRTSPYDRPLQPVVGISVFEAEAYARWLTFGSKREATLPSEAEWESAARAHRRLWSKWFETRRRWAHPGEESPLSCNAREGHVRRPTPVGVYPAGVSALGIHDLGGNVWEWTSAEWTESHAPDAAHNQPIRVVRGGSWGVSARFARCACRRGGPPARRDVSCGFRLRFVPQPNF